MQKTKILMIACAIAAMLPSLPAAEKGIDVVSIQTDARGTEISPLLYGIFFEEINRAGDGGIYAEMIQNRNFDDNVVFPIAWFAKNASIALDRSNPVNEANPIALRVASEAGGKIINKGFVGGLQSEWPRAAGEDWQKKAESQKPLIAVKKNAVCQLSFYAEAEEDVPLTAVLEDADGNVLASKDVLISGRGWKKYELELSPNQTCANAQLALVSPQKAVFRLDMVSMFPAETWKGRKNGLRPDLMAMIEDLKPAFVRFPGGCFVEGKSLKLENRARWKDSIGPVEERPGQWCLWRYQSTNGLGFHEYLQMCEDLGAEPMFVVNCGMGHQYSKPLYAAPMEEMDEYVQDALDAIEYANGPIDSKWGALRAKNGHPEPFGLKFIEIGNENWGKDYAERYALFHKAVKEKHPEITLIANEATPGCENEIIDPHLYSTPQAFWNSSTMYDDADRNGPKIYFGEFAVTRKGGKGNLQGALAEAAFMSGLERNGDHVVMSSYAPLFCRDGWEAWHPNAIFFNQSEAYGAPSYWVQRMFAHNRPDRVLPLEIKAADANEKPDPLYGRIGLGTWNTACEFKDIEIVEYESEEGAESSGGKVVKPTKDFWDVGVGKWKFVDDGVSQTSLKRGASILSKNEFRDCDLSFKARKFFGDEGFRVLFQAKNHGDYVCWNYAGWGNKESKFESDLTSVPGVPVNMEPGVWHDVKMEIRGAKIRCWVDGKLIHDAVREKTPSFSAIAGIDDETGETILKVVNASSTPREARILLNGAPKAHVVGKATILQSPTANPLDENSFSNPTKIVPETKEFQADAPDFLYEFPALSLTVLRWK